MYSKIYFSTLGLVEIIDLPLILTVMLCSDSEVTCGLGGGGGGGQFQTFKSRPYHKRTPPSLNFTVLMPMPHANLKTGFQCGGPRRFQKSPWEDSYSNTCMICSHVKVKACTLPSQFNFLLLHMQSYRSIYICKSDLTHLHMHKQ